MSSEFAIGTIINLTTLPPYLKTAEPMPILRPAQLLAVGMSGVIMARQPGEHWVVKFDRGTFLLDGKYLSAATEDVKNPPDV
jgi:Protein of unknown function (DUF3148)